MLRGLYTAASGMLLESLRLDVTSNNLANVSTTGFKGDRTAVSAFPAMLIQRIGDAEHVAARPPLIGVLGTGAALDEVRPDFSQGALRQTGRNLDVALRGPGFFVVEHEGGLAFTRDGRLFVNPQGWLTDVDGRRLLGQDGPVEVPDAELIVAEDGSLFAGPAFVDQLTVVDFAVPEALERIGEGLWAQTEESGAPVAVQTPVVASHLEMSNVQAVRAMVEMITVQRAYEANQRVIGAYDDTLGKAVNDLGAV